MSNIFDVERIDWSDLGGSSKRKTTTAAAIMKASGTDFEVVKAPIVAKFEDGHETPEAQDTFGLVRTDNETILGTVGTRYKIIQTHEQAMFAKHLLDVGDAVFVSGWVIKGGRSVGYTLLVPNEVKVGGLDTEAHQTYLHILNTFTGKGSLIVIFDQRRLRCSNEIVAKFGNAPVSYSIRHTSSYKERMKVAKHTIGLAYENSEAFTREMEALLAKAANDKTVEKVFAAIWPEPDESNQTHGKATARWSNRRDAIMTVYKESPNLDGVRDTQYGVFNAFSEWAQWGRNIRGAGGDPRASLIEAVIGTTRDINQKALSVLQEQSATKKTSSTPRGPRRQRVQDKELVTT